MVGPEKAGLGSWREWGVGLSAAPDKGDDGGGKRSLPTEKLQEAEIMNRRGRLVWILVPVLAVVASAWAMSAQAEGPRKTASVQGGGTSIIWGGTGAPAFAPITTKFAVSWSHGRGHFECLALTPSASAGDPGSGTFDKNIMYVTGSITSAEVHTRSAVLKGIATVTGAGEGKALPFTLTVVPGGPGATLVLEVSGLTFNETVLEGEIEF
jgi:hypothetical protein